MVELEESKAEDSEADEFPTEHSLGELSGIELRNSEKEHENFSLEVL